MAEPSDFKKSLSQLIKAAGDAAHHFTMPTINDAERRVNFDSLQSAVEALTRPLALAISASNIQSMRAPTANALSDLLIGTVELAREADILHEIFYTPEKLMERGITDRKDTRLDWFARKD